MERELRETKSMMIKVAKTARRKAREKRQGENLLLAIIAGSVVVGVRAGCTSS